MRSFRAMNTDVTVTAPAGEPAIAARIAETFARAELRFSRFRRDSELSKLNRCRTPLVVSTELFGALARARRYVELTNGLFDPGIGGVLSALGYDRSFAPGALDRASASKQPERGSLVEVELDEATHTVNRPEHVTIDLGGMIKGATVDAAVGHLNGSGAIDAGGDAVLRGRGPTGDAWLVDVEDPLDSTRSVVTVAVSNTAVATSAANRRCWHVGGVPAHHLIDPRTRAPAQTDLLQATVFAPRAEWADVLAKTAFLLGIDGARRFLDGRPHTGAVLVPRHGAPIFIGTLDIREDNRG